MFCCLILLLSCFISPFLYLINTLYHIIIKCQ
nr:MAG TPA: hypothetical protein [Caudoviricetes sp.]